MQNNPSQILVDSIKRLLRRSANSHLKKIVNKTHAADLSVAFRSISLSDQLHLFSMIEDIEQKGALFSELEEDIFLDLIEELQLDEIVAILETMPTDEKSTEEVSS